MRQITKSVHRQGMEGELLPPEDDTMRSLVPVQSAPIRIRLPQVDDAPSLAHEIRRPTRAPTLESDVLVPGAQTFLTAAAVGIAVALLAWACSWSWRVPVAVLGAALALSWLWRLGITDSLLWEIETLTGRDVNRDGAVGQPQGQPVLVNPWQARAEAAQVVADDDAQDARRELVTFLARCFTAGCSETAHGVKASGPDRTAYVKHRDALLALGVAAWKNPARPRAGWRIVVSHQRAMDLITRHTL